MKKPVKIALIVLCVIFLSIFVYSGYKLISTLHEYKVAEDTYNKISSDFVSTKKDKDKDKDGSDGNQITESSPVDVDFDALLNQCQDVVGCCIRRTPLLTTPLCRRRTTSIICTGSSTGSITPPGSLFLDCTCYGDFSGKNTVLYGHNMNDGSMLASIRNYKDQEYYNEHPRHVPQHSDPELQDRDIQRLHHRRRIRHLQDVLRIRGGFRPAILTTGACSLSSRRTLTSR